ncbi:hypothetical protein COEREDRAFT_86558 [Coemansia reversa NRRL 1564]|uniref:Uncharacterized protein n=1 Tax=Coemansia reversa (strain ATCC 12441 / NRRL 1564) TaxID=763665 RepID=A0A2G5BDU3_COERN|nr:hypothetical protein COEREDRAFT_86558 [Coemansia reversa NRRL 1564]|eukprot:PIA17171.1 hypothetical protein COEREDRAFT_86558 [Coemansia reversa NRRL 1564]
MANNVSEFCIEQRPKRKPSPGPIGGEPMATRSRKRRAFGSSSKTVGMQKSISSNGISSTFIDRPINSGLSGVTCGTGKRKDRSADGMLFEDRLANGVVDQRLKRRKTAVDSPMQLAEQQSIANENSDNESDHDDNINDKDFIGIPRLSVIKMPLALRAQAYLHGMKSSEWQHSNAKQKESISAENNRNSDNSALVRYNPNSWLYNGMSTINPDDSTRQLPLPRSPTSDSTSSMDVD